MSNKVSRREFIRLSAMATVGAVSAACAAAPSGSTAPPTAQPETVAETGGAAPASTYQEAPMLAEQVAAGTLPPVDERLPQTPLVVPVVEEIGQYGGTWRRVWLGPSDSTGMWRLVGEPIMRWNADSTDVIPNVVESVEVNENATEFTLNLRSGMRWSDGEPFTADDFMFWYEDMQLNEELTPVQDVLMKLGDEFGQMEKIDDYTIKISFSNPYGTFMLQMGNLVPYVPGHYLQQFHPAYADEGELDAMVSDAGFDEWYQLFQAKNSWVNNAELPVIHPWITAGDPTGPQWPAERNPYYWKIDEAGNQLPYIDRIVHELLQNTELATLKVVAGDIDMQQRHLNINDLPLYMESRESGDYRVLLWPSDWGTSHTLYFNQNYEAEPVTAEFVRNLDFRRALSIAINRDEINEVVYLGLGTPRQPTLIPQSPGYNEEWETAYTEYDPERAEQMLDDLGLTERNADGFRLRPDGEGPLTITISHPNNLDSDPTEMVKTYWEAVGIQTAIDVQERSVHYERLEANELAVAVWGNSAMIYPMFLLYPWWVMPYGTISRMAPLSGLWYQTSGAQGVEPEGDLLRLIELYEQAKSTPDEDERFETAMEMMRINAENLWSVGTVLSGDSPVVVKNNFRNVPEKHLIGTVNLAPGNANPWTWFFQQS